MKLDPKTLAVLQNFQTINPMIAIQPGNVIRTMSPTETIIAKATVPNEFPLEFGIHDLSRFLAITSIVKDAAVEFDTSFMTIVSGKTKIKYVYCDTDMMIKPPKKEIVIPSIDVEFELKPEVYASLMKALSVLRYSRVAITGDGTTLMISTVNDKNKNSDVFSVDLGQTDKKFQVYIEVELLKIMPMNYLVQISKSGMAYFKGDSVEYWIATHASSKFE